MSRKILIVEDQFVEANSLQNMVEKAGYSVCGIARTVPDAINMVERHQPHLVLLDIQLKGPLTGIDLAEILSRKNIAFIYVSANSNHETLKKAKATHPYGFIVKPFREKDVLVTLEIAHYRHENSLETAVRKEDMLNERLQAIIGLDSDWPGKMLDIAKALQNFLSYDYLACCTNKGVMAGKLTSFLRIGFDEYQEIGLEEFQVITNLKMSEIEIKEPAAEFEQRQACYIGKEFMAARQSHPMIGLIADTFKLESMCLLPLILSDGSQFKFAFYSRRPHTYSQGQALLIERLKKPLKVAIEQLLAQEMEETSEIPSACRKKKENKHEEGSLPAFEGIIGKSPLLFKILDDVVQVSQTSTSVLILGESGTGKEKIAQSIHQISQRRDCPFVKINCAAFPSNLIESELFGHEKGAFTGAFEKRIGKFERANRGTIFLDEIGDMPHDLQAKLLRVLQEKEIERIGGSDPIKVDVRVIAATNQNLEDAVASGRFRLDLYYRLNVFPIHLPALRERREDIPLLADFFIRHYNALFDKSVSGLSETALKRALQYDWPGNIRELQNMVERAVLVFKGEGRLDLVFGGEKQPHPSLFDAEKGMAFKSIDEMERDHIINALRQCQGKVWGTGGAAELLNLPASTLSSKIKKYGIKRDYQ